MNTVGIGPPVIYNRKRRAFRQTTLQGGNSVRCLDDLEPSAAQGAAESCDGSLVVSYEQNGVDSRCFASCLSGGGYFLHKSNFYTYLRARGADPNTAVLLQARTWSAGIGRPRKYPCAISQRRDCKTASCCEVSTPSAITRTPMFRASCNTAWVTAISARP